MVYVIFSFRNKHTLEIRFASKRRNPDEGQLNTGRLTTFMSSRRLMAPEV